MRFVLTIAIAMLVPLGSLAADKSSVSQRMSLVGFIRVGASDAQSLVVLKEKSSGKTLFLRRFEMIPGTPYRLLRFERDHVLLQSPGGREVLRMESAQGRDGEEPTLAEAESVPAISINPNNWQQLMQKNADAVPVDGGESRTAETQDESQAKANARDLEPPSKSKEMVPVTQEETEIITWEPPLEASDSCPDCVRNEAAAQDSP